TLFYRGAFTANDVAMSAASLMAYTPGLLGFILVKVLVPGYFSRQDTKTPVKIGVRALGVGVVLNIVFVLVLLQTGWAPPHAGLAAATSLASLANAWMLYRGLVAAGVYRPLPGWPRVLTRIVVATAVMAVVVVFAASSAGDWLVLGSGLRILWLAGIVGGGAGIYFVAGWLMGLRPAQFRSP
ncbi:MAG: lipid II flippase MurJ, partial [Gammaproteobacteria bacterium]|nr:lipid II flippase MurJ [Gammaproteobacteria bacterium]